MSLKRLKKLRGAGVEQQELGDKSLCGLSLQATPSHCTHSSDPFVEQKNINLNSF